MIEEHYLAQLQKRYTIFLSELIKEKSFTPIRLRGGKSKPKTSTILHAAIASFLRYEKVDNKPGWEIEWETWQSRLLGTQRWPSSVIVYTESDFLYLLKKEKEVASFRELMNQLLSWRPTIAPWLAERPQKVLVLKEHWKGICAVVDYLLNHDVKGYYIRSLPVPVHTKFIQQNNVTILSLLQHFDRLRFPVNVTNLEKALSLQEKPTLHSMRWLDISLAEQYSSGMNVLGVSPISLQALRWSVGEIWIVENETNLYLLPHRQNGMAIFSKGYALHQLQKIPLFTKSKLIYWGDLDEDGFLMLHQFRQYYPHVQSIFMDEATVLFHQKEMSKVPFRLKRTDLLLQPNEAAAYKILMEQEGRIEQEQLLHEYMQFQLANLV